MNHLKSLSFTAVPKGERADPVLIRREKLIARLEEQKTLAKDPTFAPTVTRSVKNAEGIKEKVEVKKPLRPNWSGLCAEPCKKPSVKSKALRFATTFDLRLIQRSSIDGISRIATTRRLGTMACPVPYPQIRNPCLRAGQVSRWCRKRDSNPRPRHYE